MANSAWASLAEAGGQISIVFVVGSSDLRLENAGRIAMVYVHLAPRVGIIDVNYFPEPAAASSSIAPTNSKIIRATSLSRSSIVAF